MVWAMGQVSVLRWGWRLAQRLQWVVQSVRVLLVLVW